MISVSVGRSASPVMGRVLLVYNETVNQSKVRQTPTKLSVGFHICHLGGFSIKFLLLQIFAIMMVSEVIKKETVKKLPG